VIPSRLRRIARALWVVLALVILVPPIVMELAAASPPLPSATITLPPARGDFHVYVADWGYHTSVLFEQPAGWRLGPVDDENAPYVEFAWGDRRFYMESNYQPQSVFATLFLPTSSVTYVAGWNAPPERDAQPRTLYARTVSAAQLSALVASLESSIRRDAANTRVPPFAPVAGYAGRFYPAHGDYLWWFDCNRWTVDRLAAAGLARGGRGVIFTRQVRSRLIGFHTVRPPVR
jgi:hypothetical protein